MANNPKLEESYKVLQTVRDKADDKDAISKYIPGAFIVIPDVNEERAIKYLSGLIGLGIEDSTPLMDWYYSPFRKGRIQTDFWVSFGPVGDKQLLETPEDFYDFYVGDNNDQI